MHQQHSSGLLTRAFRCATVSAAALVLGAVCADSAAAADDVCISPKAKDSLATCPGGALKTASGKKPAVSFKTAPTGINLKKGDQQTKPGAPVASMTSAQRDERRNRLAARSRQLLVTEIQGLESLFASTPKGATDRPKLMRRLAEGYVELESAAFRDKTEGLMKADEARAKDPARADALKTEAGKAEKVLGAARKAAINYYTLLKGQYPKWCQNNNASDPSKSTGCTDEVLYYLAYEYEQAQRLDEARKVYLDLIGNWPQSKYIPNAYLAFGELFFNEAQGDPSRWDLAEKSYLEVTKYPAPENKVWGYAHYKLAYVYWNKGDFPRAMSEFKKTIEYGTQYKSLPNAEQLAVSARRDIVPIYALAGDPRKAFDFFRPLSGDSGGTDKTFKLMDDLGQNYLDTGHYAEGIALYQDLMTRDRGPRFCLYQGHITEATLAMKSGSKDGVMSELKHQLEVHNKFMAEDKPAEAKLKCANVTADLLSETAMAWHLEAVGSGGVRGTGDRRTMQLASQLYEDVVKTFKQEDFQKFEFPRIVKEDWPTIFKIKYAMADLLYFNKDWAKCGPAFDAVVAEDPNGPQAAEAAYASVLCYQNIYTETHQNNADKKSSGNLPTAAGGKKGEKKNEKVKLNPKDFSEGQKGMITAFNRYICYIKPNPSDKEAYENYVEVKFARARTYFEAQHWEEAAVAFKDIAMSYPDKEVGIYAAQFYLESMNVLGTAVEHSRPSCVDEMGQDVPKFIELYCKGEKEKQNGEQCGMLLHIQRDLERLVAEGMVKRADNDKTPEAAKYYEKAATQYLDMWKKYAEGPCEAKQQAGCERAEEVLYNAAKAFQAARLIAKAIAVRKILIDPKYNLNNTELAKQAVYEIGGNYQAIAVYEEAANWYERYAAANAKNPKAADALQDATVLRLGLGMEDQAIKDSELFNRQFGSQKAAQTAAIAFAIGAHYVDREDWSNARKRLTGAMGLIDRNASIDVQIQAHAMLGRVFVHLNTATNATSEYNKVRGMWKDPAAVVKKLEGDDRKLGKALTAVGEALFYFAEQQRKEVDKIKFPEYKGSGKREEVVKHVNTKVADWVKKKRPAIEKASNDYLQIVKLEPAPPPRWVIAAGSRVGQMWGKFVAEFRAAPIPKEWKGHGLVPGTTDLTFDELRGEYYAKLDEASEPQKLQAKGAFKTCLDYSVKYQYFDEYSRKCEEWLSKNYGAEYHLIDEFRGAPSRVNSGLSDQPQPLNVDGTLYRLGAALVTSPKAAAAAAPAAPAAAHAADDETK